MYKEVTFLLIGVCLGTYLGIWMSLKMLLPSVGDDFEINKPKIKGEGNTLEVTQQIENKKQLIKRIFNRKKNGFN
jgi:hypothetical protein